MKISHTSEMAIHGLWELSISEEDGHVLVSDIADRHQVSASYLAKVFHRLGRAGIVVSRRGKVGGFMLARPANEITLGEIIRIFEDDICPVNFDEKKSIENRNPRELALFGVLHDVEDSVFNILDNVSLADLNEKSPSAESPVLHRRKYTRRRGKA